MTKTRGVAEVKNSPRPQRAANGLSHGWLAGWLRKPVLRQLLKETWSLHFRVFSRRFLAFGYEGESYVHLREGEQTRKSL